MAKYEKEVTGNFRDILNKIERAVLGGSISAKYESGADYRKDGLEFAVRVYERYSFTGKNRVSMTVTAGGSQGMFLKVNRFGENAFLNTIRDLLDCL